MVEDPAEPRIRVWLPPGYEAGAGSYRTLYMLDGQYVFASDSEGTNFAADRRVAGLAAAGRIHPVLIVAIDNLEDNRFYQYMPQTIYDRSEGGLRAVIELEISRISGQRLVSAQFIHFLTTRLKPFIDAHYRTLAGRLDTAIFGASMAGVMAGAIFAEGQGCSVGLRMSPNGALQREESIPALLSLWPDYFRAWAPPPSAALLDHGTLMMALGWLASARHARRWPTGLAPRRQPGDALSGRRHAFAQSAAPMALLTCCWPEVAAPHTRRPQWSLAAMLSLRNRGRARRAAPSLDSICPTTWSNPRSARSRRGGASPFVYSLMIRGDGSRPAQLCARTRAGGDAAFDVSPPSRRGRSGSFGTTLRCRSRIVRLAPRGSPWVERPLLEARRRARPFACLYDRHPSAGSPPRDRVLTAP